VKRTARVLLLSLPWIVVLCRPIDAADAPCRPAYVIPLAEQCNYGHASLLKDASPANVQAAFTACGRAQNEAANCLEARDRQTHVIALSALYRDVSMQADIAMFAAQFETAEQLLRERMSVLDAVAREARPGDTAVAAQRADVLRDLAVARAGECTEHAFVAGAPARMLAHAHKYDELAKLLQAKHQKYESCASLGATADQRAYIRYLGVVALEESGRAQQAGGHASDAHRTYSSCIDAAAGDAAGASSTTGRYLATIGQLCRGRMSGKYGVDQPQPLDAVNAHFQPLALPKS